MSRAKTIRSRVRGECRWSGANGPKCEHERPDADLVAVRQLHRRCHGLAADDRTVLAEILQRDGVAAACMMARYSRRSAMDEKTLTIINRGGKEVTIPRERVARLDVSVGRKRNVLGGFLAGAAIGAALGPLAAACKPGQFCPGPPTAVVIAVTGAAFGGIGAGVGHFVKTEKWVKLPMNRVGVGLQPASSGRGGALTANVAF